MLIIVITDGLKIYPKSLKDAGKGRSRGTQVRVCICSRQQRVSNPVKYFTLHLLSRITFFSYLKGGLNNLNEKRMR